MSKRKLFTKMAVAAYIESEKIGGYKNICPFGWLNHNHGARCVAHFCGPVFGNWKSYASRRFLLDYSFECPCMHLNTEYVIKKFRRWLKGGD